MAALVRIKRRLDEDPLETLILNCKKRKTNEIESNDSEELSTVFQLAGTSNDEEQIENVIKKHRLGNFSELKQDFKKHEVNLNDKLRSEIRNSSKNNRYRVVNCFRKILNESEPESEEVKSSTNSEVVVFDLESNSTDTKIDLPESDVVDRSRYVYDFYYTSSDDFGEAAIDEYVSIMPVDKLVFGSLRDNGFGIASDSDNDSEDSNAENNWRNDYPDEDDMNSIHENDMVDALQNLNIGNELSSDEGEEDYVYSRDEEDYQDTEQEVDKEDELRYGKLYAKFKAKNKNIETSTLAKDFYYGDIDEEEYYY